MRILGGASALLLLLLPQSDAVTPTAQLDVRPSKGQPYSLYTSQASFGSLPPMSASNNPSRIVTLPPESNALLCDNIASAVSGSSSTKTIMLVPRGECTFEVKAQNAQLLGADAILIYGTLASRYSVNETKHEDEKYPAYDLSDIIYPKASFDYDCIKGRAEVPAPDIRFKPLPYNAEHNDPILTGDNDDNLCKLYSPTQLRDCPSKMCLLTGNYGKNDDESKLEVCCAWDLHVWLYKDTAMNTTITIPASYLTMEQGIQLLSDVQAGNVQAVLSSRYRPDYNFSSILIWALGVFVAALAAYLSAGDYHHKIKKVLHRAQVRASSDEPRRSRHKENVDGLSIEQTPLPMQEETLELTPIHALGFMVMSSAGLFILFFFKIYSFVKVMYAFGCSGAVMQVITLPLVTKIAKRLRVRDFVVWKTGTADFGDISYLEIIAFILGYGLGFSWLYVAFFVRHPGEYVFFWVMQDVMGACMCITFLSIIKLNSIRVAAVLLTAAFFYDIFMVFVTPYIFAGKSVMIIVATSGGPPKADPSWCEKYPDDVDCQGGDPLPMLLTMPRFGDYLGGSSLLGLGDIVLPGLLLSFAARMDAAKSLVGVVGGGSGSLNSHSCPERKFCWNCCCCSGGYFTPLVIAYAVGLMIANTAVYLMQMGQPALLYLVPCTLGTMAFMGWRRNELRGLWEGPRVISTADEIVYGGRLPLPESASNPGIEPIEGMGSNQQEDDGEEDDGEDAGDVPLLSTNPTLSP